MNNTLRVLAVLKNWPFFPLFLCKWEVNKPHYQQKLHVPPNKGLGGGGSGGDTNAVLRGCKLLTSAVLKSDTQSSARSSVDFSTTLLSCIVISPSPIFFTNLMNWNTKNYKINIKNGVNCQCSKQKWINCTFFMYDLYTHTYDIIHIYNIYIYIYIIYYIKIITCDFFPWFWKLMNENLQHSKDLSYYMYVSMYMTCCFTYV